MPMEKIIEIQAHGKGVTRMRMTFDNNFLFTTAKDGTLMIHEIKDRDPRGGLVKKERDLGGITTFSEEILTEKTEIEEDRALLEQLSNEL